MGARYRITALSPKPQVPTAPDIPCNYILTIDIDGTAAPYLEFWGNRFLGRVEGPQLDALALEALGGGYFVQAEAAELPPDEFAVCYAATYNNRTLAQACESLLQLGIRARIQICVATTSRTLCSLTIGTARDSAHVLGQFFPELVRISPRQFQAAAGGRLVQPRVLTSLTIPILPGVGETGPLPIEVPARIRDSKAIQVGQYLSPYNSRPVAPAHLTPTDLLRGTAVLGTVGSGKTTLVQGIIQATLGQASVLALDIKREYRSLMKTAGAKIYAFSGPSILTHNLLKPQGPPDRWIKEFADILAECISRHVPASGSKDFVVEVLDHLFRKRGIYEGGVDYPHIGDLVEELEARSQNTRADRERNWIASALRVLRTLCVGSTRQAFCVREGLALERLLEGVVVVELEGIGDSTGKALVVSVLMQKIRNRLLASEERDVLKHVVVIEEAQNLLSKGQEATSFIADMCRELRGLGCGIVAVSQLPSELSKNFLANANTIFCLKLVHPEDKSVAANMLGLEREAAKLIGELPVGRALMRTEKVGLIAFPRVERPVVRDGELEPTIVDAPEVSANAAARTEVANRIVNLKPREWEIFTAVCEAREIHPSGLKALFGYSHSDIEQILSMLVRRGLLLYCRASRNSRKARTNYFPSPDGKEAYRQRTGRYPDRKTEPSPNHGEMLARVISRLGIERKLHPRFDLLFDENGADRAIEVESGANNDEQLDKNLAKSIEFQGHGRFVAADQITYNRIVQAAARFAFGKRSQLTLMIGLEESLPDWHTFGFEAAALRPNEF